LTSSWNSRKIAAVGGHVGTGIGRSVDIIAWPSGGYAARVSVWEVSMSKVEDKFKSSRHLNFRLFGGGSVSTILRSGIDRLKRMFDKVSSTSSPRTL
jgi:hypothetical protein